MVGEAKSLVIDEELPEGVRLRQITADENIQAFSVMVDTAYGLNRAEHYARRLSGLIAGDMGVEIWAAEVDGKIIGGGRLDPVPGTEFAGLWSGGMLPEWRGQGIYRALTSVRARSALAMGKTLIQCECSVYSRPILERSGLVKTSETTPYLWQRA
jgi:GNAT superfamily N-acetyltransferase